MSDREKLLHRLGAEMVRLRSRRGYSQQYVASRLGVQRTSVADYERGQCLAKVDKLVAFGKLVGVPAWKILAKAQGVDEAEVLKGASQWSV